MSAPSPDYSWVAEGLAVGAALPPDAAGALGRAGIGAVIDLRAEGRDDPAALAAQGIGFLHLPTPDHHALHPADMEGALAFAREAAEAGRGLLVHCREGIGRSVTLALLVLIDRGEAPLDALERIKAARPIASPSPAQFDAVADWLAARGLTVPPFESFAAIAYRHLR